MISFRKNKPVEKVDYELFEALNNKEWWNVRVLTGKYQGTEFYFGTVKVNENHGKLSFNVKVLNSPQNVKNTDKQFQKYSGTILNAIIESEHYEQQLP
jgi:hypothetical protein